MPKKKQHYIYVARDKNPHIILNRNHYLYKKSFEKMKLNTLGFFVPYDRGATYNICHIKLKKGEQVRIPIDVEKAEKV